MFNLSTMRTSKELQAQINVLTRIHNSLPSRVLSQLIDDLEEQRGERITEEVESYRYAVAELTHWSQAYEFHLNRSLTEIKPDHIVSSEDEHLAKKYGEMLDTALKAWLPVEECLEDVSAIELPKGMEAGKLYIQPSGAMECKTSHPYKGCLPRTSENT